MQIVTASQELTISAHTIIASGMAFALFKSSADLRCLSSVSETLSRAGFGKTSIRVLAPCAVVIAGQVRAVTKKVH